MKNRAGTGVVLVVLASFTCLTATGLAAEEKSGQAGKTEIKDDFIVVHPGTKLSKADAQALNGVLKQYDKSLYKIKIYKNGKVTKTMGTLNDMYLDQKTVADFNEAKKAGQSERAIQLIAPSAGPQKGAAVNPIQGSPSPGVAVNPHQGSPTPGVAVNPQTNTPMPRPPKTSGPMPSGPQQPTSPVPSGPQQSSPSPVNPQRSAATNKQAAEFMQRLKPILEKYSQ
jgi:hypothetical protein